MNRMMSIGAAVLVMLSASGNAAVTNFERYDALGRLSASCQWTTSSAQRVEYSHDPGGNRSKYRSFSTMSVIPTNTGLDSSNGLYHLVMQPDGNLVFYKGVFGTPWAALWASNTAGSGGNNSAYVQADGNFVVYRQDGTAIWTSGTYGKWCAALYVQPDGKAVMYDLDGHAVWSIG